MKPEVNLAQALPKRVFDFPSMPHFLRMGVVFLALLLAVYSLSAWRYSHLQQQLQTVKTKQRKLNDRLLSVGINQNDGEKLEQLQSEVNNLVSQLARKQGLKSRLENMGYSSVGGFYTVLKTLAQHNKTGVWLQKIIVINNGMDLSLKGSALDSTMVTRYLDALGQTSLLRGRRFKTLRIAHDKQSDEVTFFASTLERGQDEGTVETS